MFSSPCSLLWSFLSLVLSWSQLPLTYCFISALFLPFHSCPLSLFQPCLLGLFIIFCPYSFPVLIYFLFVFWIFPCDQPVFVLPFPSYLVMDSPVLDFNAEDTVNAYMRMERHQESKKQDNSIPDAQYVYNTLNQEFRQSREAWAKLVPTFKYKAKLLRKLLQSAVIIFFPGKLALRMMLPSGSSLCGRMLCGWGILCLEGLLWSSSDGWHS